MDELVSSHSGLRQLLGIENNADFYSDNFIDFSYERIVDNVRLLDDQSAHYIVGALSKLDISIGDQTETVNLPDDQRENLSRITINAGLRFFL